MSDNTQRISELQSEPNDLLMAMSISQPEKEYLVYRAERNFEGSLKPGQVARVMFYAEDDDEEGYYSIPILLLVTNIVG